MSERDWKAEYGMLPEHVREAIYQRAKTSCPSCGVAGVPASWAVVAHEVSQDWQDAALEAVYQWDGYVKATNAVDQSSRLIELGNAMHDLKTWLPGWDTETGTMPWDRGEDT